MTAKMLRHLLWKDARSVRPLILAAVLAIAGFYLLLFLYAKSTTDPFTEQVTLAYVIWIMVPNLFAFSLPAFLIGSEEESGSLAWLKTLPASWKSIALSKFLIALGYTVVVWLISTIGLRVVFGDRSRRRFPDGCKNRVRRRGLATTCPRTSRVHVRAAVGLDDQLLRFQITHHGTRDGAASDLGSAGRLRAVGRGPCRFGATTFGVS